jgi:hypothetical protein
MRYTRLRLPEGFPEELEAFVTGSIEPYLMDAHAMLITVGPTFDVDHPPHLLGHSIALTLLTVVSGLADTLYATKGTNKEKFVGILKSFYPWNRCQAYGPSNEEASNLLYREFRNPIAHRVGIRPADGMTMMIYVRFPGSGDPDTEDKKLLELEASNDPPSNLTLNVDSCTCALDVRTFYWGIRQMIESMAADQGRWKEIVDWMGSHKFMGR